MLTVEVPPAISETRTASTPSRLPTAVETREAQDPHVRPVTEKSDVIDPAGAAAGTDFSCGAQQAHPDEDVSARGRVVGVPHIVISVRVVRIS